MSPEPQPQLPKSLRDLSTPPHLHLYTADTPNGYKVTVLLEELVAAYPEAARKELSYDYRYLIFDNKDQKQPEYLKINPNGRIPALVDDNHKDANGKSHRVFETSSMLLWLVEEYDKEFKFWFQDKLERSEALNWIFFGHGGVGPMQGQSNHFFRYAPEKIEYGINRYNKETQRLYSVIEGHLAENNSDYIVGNKFSIVDISMFGWVREHNWAGVKDMSPFPRVSAWLDRIHARPAVDAGLDIPKRERRSQMTPEEQEAYAKKSSAWIMEGNK